VGFVVPKYGHTAVSRNRVKRQLREIVRTSILSSLLSVDVVIKTYPDVYAAPFSTIADELLHQYAVVYDRPGHVRSLPKLNVSVTRPGVQLRAPSRTR